MRTTLNLNDELLDRAREVTGIERRGALIHEGLRVDSARSSTTSRAIGWERAQSGCATTASFGG